MLKEMVTAKFDLLSSYLRWRTVRNHERSLLGAKRAPYFNPGTPYSATRVMPALLRVWYFWCKSGKLIVSFIECFLSWHGPENNRREKARGLSRYMNEQWRSEPKNCNFGSIVTDIRHLSVGDTSMRLRVQNLKGSVTVYSTRNHWFMNFVHRPEF